MICVPEMTGVYTYPVILDTWQATKFTVNVYIQGQLDEQNVKPVGLKSL